MSKPNFKMTKFYVDSNEEAAMLQKAMFVLGFKWAHGGTDQRKVLDVFSKGGYIYVNHECRMYWSGRYTTPEPHYSSALQAAVFAAAEARKAEKRVERKASRRRKALRKQGWIINTGVEPDGEIAQLLFTDGLVFDTTNKTWRWTLSDGGEGLDILAYRPKQLEKTISMEGMFTDVAASIGKEVAVVPVETTPFAATPQADAGGWIEWDGDTSAAIGDLESSARGTGARFNAGKPDFSLIPMTLLEGEARVWAYGAKKYKAWNWMKGMNWSVPFACAMRHMAAWQRGEEVDPETGESHLDHAMCNLRMLRYYADHYKEGDDRPTEFFSVKGNV